MLCEVEFDSDEYQQTIKLRQKVLRDPLGLKFTKEDLEQDKTSHHLTLWENNELLACLVLTQQAQAQEQCIRMRQVAVKVSEQGKGLGKKLVGFSETFASERGFKKIIAHARHTATPFYEKSGYRCEGKPFDVIAIKHYLVVKDL